MIDLSLNIYYKRFISLFHFFFIIFSVYFFFFSQKTTLQRIFSVHYFLLSKTIEQQEPVVQKPINANPPISEI